MVKVSLTTDMWTSEAKANDSYLGLSCHHLSQEFELCLAIEPFSGRHTGVNVASGINNILSEYVIDKSTVSAVIINLHCMWNGEADTALATHFNWQ